MKPVREAAESSFKAGMYLLENLTSGMYIDPLSLYREYIQNAVDSIDIGLSDGTVTVPVVDITLNPSKRSIAIRDNGIGIPATLAKEVLSSIGSSNKHDGRLRGFRGIGRLGGIAFSNRATFRTKAFGDNVESIQEWNCQKMRQLITDRRYSLTFQELFDQVTTFSQHNGTSLNHCYFEVILDGVSSFRNQVFDIERIHSYISQVAPVPFDYNLFSQGAVIDQHFSDCLITHNKAYCILLNGNQVFKPYRNVIHTSIKYAGGADIIKEVKFFEINDRRGALLAKGWYGLREYLLGSIRKGEKYSGIRVRVGNILIGDAHLLDKCFREERFNSYLTGEIYVASSQLIPNSRRDDFIDNDAKTDFYNAVEKTVGLPLSKEIRLQSRIMSASKQSHTLPKETQVRTNMDETVKLNATEIKKQVVSCDYKIQQATKIINELRTKCHDCERLSDIRGIFDF